MAGSNDDADADADDYSDEAKKWADEALHTFER